ncbi:MAG TPA: molybdate ABC transporter substrate-binding protein [Vicinamibacterales bacterium]|nr:molybdate ABC transporter substrate-binding protein [Vicinamibacterales bacterium]
METLTTRGRLGAALVIGLAVASARPALNAQSPARALSVAAASDLQTTLPGLVARFERSAGVKVAVSFASSGALFAQIQNGAPFDVFFSADIDYPKRLIASGHAESGSLYEYATGRIVLWTRQNSGVDVTRGLTVLRDSRVRRIAIANPQTAPYGRAAVAALRHDKLYDAVQGKLVLGENISQAAQLVDSGNADAGIIAMSLALGPAMRARGRFKEIPASAHPPIEQGVVITSASRAKGTARQLLDYLKRPEAIELLQHSGFASPAVPAR